MEERKAIDAYLGRGVRKIATESSILTSSSRWLNNAMIRDVLATWLLRKNGPDLAVEADHTLGLVAAFSEVQSDDEVNGLFEEERKVNPALDAWLEQGFISTYTNGDFAKYPPGTVGGIMGHQIRHHGFDLTFGLDWTKEPRPKTPYDYWRLRYRQTHDFEHIVIGSQFNSIGEIPVIVARWANQAAHLGPKLNSALSAYALFTGFRLISRALLHYPEVFPKVMECLEQGLKVGRAASPIWMYKFEDVFHLTPPEAREKLGVKHAYVIESRREGALFREEPMREGALTWE